MAYEEILRTITLEAGQNLSAMQYFFVTQAAGDGQIDPTAITARATGVLQNAPAAAGRAATVAIAGSVSKVSAGAAFARGANLAADANGQAITAAGGGTHINAIALEAALALGDIVTCQVLDGTETV